MNLAEAVARQLPISTELRRRLHTIPELGFHEFKTAAMIREELKRLNIDFIGDISAAPTATIAIIGDPNKCCVALRADIDALPILEQTKLPYSSRHVGVMHACGHDGHTANLLGVGAILREMQSELPVCVKLIFQPAEEGGGGGNVLCEAGVLDGRIGPKVSAIFGLHGWPGMPVGLVSTRPGPLLAATDSFTATFVGRGCHGAFPHLGIDPIVPAAEAVINLQQFVSREIDPTEPAVVTVGMFNAGTATNVIPDRATIAGTARTLTREAREMIKASIERRCRGIAMAANCQLEFSFSDGYPATINDPQMADRIADLVREKLGPDRYVPAARPAMGGEDFAYYLERVPGCFFLIGVCPPGQKTYPSLHNDHFDFTDAAFATGMQTMIEAVLSFG